MATLLQELVSQLPSGRPSSPVDIDTLGRWLRERYFSDKEKQRIFRAKRRQELYCSAGDLDMASFISQVFKDRDVIAKRLDWVEKAKYNNVLRRVVNELSTVYAEPAVRRVSQGNEKYQDLQRICRQHEMFRRINRWGNLHRNLAVGFRVRKDSEISRVPVIDVVTPDAFRAVSHPLDGSRLIALIFDLKYDGPAHRDQPGHIVWTDREFFYLSKEQHVLKDTIQEHGFSRMPWLLFSLEPPAGELLDTMTGEDLVAAHRAVWFENICLLKESKSATKMPLLSGDMTSTARGQAVDTESVVEVPDGTSVSMVDMSMDLNLFSSTARIIYETAAANYGLPPAILSHQGVQSAEARELMRAPLKELRREQIGYFREFERNFAEVQSMVLAEDLPELGFSTDSWTIDFGEHGTPLGRKEELEIFEQERRLGITNTVDELLKRNPDLSEDQAVELIVRNIDIEVIRNKLMRPLQEISGGMNQDMQAPDAEDDSGEVAA